MLLSSDELNTTNLIGILTYVTSPRVAVPLIRRPKIVETLKLTGVDSEVVIQRTGSIFSSSLSLPNRFWINPTKNSLPSLVRPIKG